MTQLFETEQDLENERAAVIRFAALTNSVPYKMPMRSMVDYIMMRGPDAKAIVEVKCRTSRSDQYPQYLLSEKKYNALCKWQERDLTPILLVSWTDAIGYVPVPIGHDKAVGGRYDDKRNVEPIVLIDIGKFKMI